MRTPQSIPNGFGLKTHIDNQKKFDSNWNDSTLKRHHELIAIGGIEIAHCPIVHTRHEANSILCI